MVFDPRISCEIWAFARFVY